MNCYKILLSVSLKLQMSEQKWCLQDIREVLQVESDNEIRTPERNSYDLCFANEPNVNVETAANQASNARYSYNFNFV